jgi:hypothetical protein
MTDKALLLDPSAFENDEVTVAFGARGVGSSAGIAIPERLVARLVALGAAYELHLASLIEVHGELEFNSQQCVSLADELRFIGEVVNDAAIHKALTVLLPIVDAVGRSSSGILEVQGN